MIKKIKGIFEIHSPSKQMWECDTWHRDDFPPVAEGMKNVSIEVEVQLENRKIVPAIYARLDGRWYLAEGRIYLREKKMDKNRVGYLTAEEKEREDQEQIEYLRKWKEKREKKREHRRKVKLYDRLFVGRKR